MNNAIKVLLVSLTIARQVTASQSLFRKPSLLALNLPVGARCSRSCASCKTTSTCDVCYQGKAIGGVCQQSNADNCLFYDNGAPGKCVLCKRGYTIGGERCRPSTIRNCAEESYFNGQKVCLQCWGGYPTKDNKACSDFYSGDAYGQLDNGKTCQVGERLVNNGYKCALCNKGYARLLGERRCSQDVLYPYRGAGCAVYDNYNERCDLCHVDFGYVATIDGSCVKA